MDVDGTKRIVVEDDEGKQSAKQGEGVTGMGMWKEEDEGEEERGFIQHIV